MRRALGVHVGDRLQDSRRRRLFVRIVVRMFNAIDYVAGNRARVVFIGINVGASVPAKLGLIQSKALRIQGVIGSAGLWPATIRSLASGVIEPDAIVTSRFPLGSPLETLEGAQDTVNKVKVHVQTA